MPEITLVQAPAGTGTSATFSPAPVNGHLLIAIVWNATGTPAVATGWHLTTSIASSPFGAIFLKVAGASESTTQTPTVTASCTMVIGEFSWSGGSFTSNLDQHSFSHHASINPPQTASTAITPAQANCFAFIGWMSDSGGATDTAPATVSGMTKATDIPAANSLGTGTTFYQTDIGTASYSKTGVWTGSSAAACAVGVSVVTPPVFTSALSGSSAPSGSQSKSAARALLGSITAIGYLFGGFIRMVGTLNAVLLHFAVSLGGSIAATGSALRSIGAPLTGSSAATGTKTESVSSVVSGAATATGSKTESVFRRLSATVTPAGSFLRLYAKALSGVISASGGVSRTVRAVLSGSVTAVGTGLKAIRALLSATLSLSGFSARAITRQLAAAALTPTASLSRAFSKVFAAAVAFVGQLVNRVSRTQYVYLTLPISGNPDLDLPILAEATLSL